MDKELTQEVIDFAEREGFNDDAFEEPAAPKIEINLTITLNCPKCGAPHVLTVPDIAKG